MKFLDTKDLEIIKVVDRLGSKASTELISQELAIPARTVRYRLAMMKKRGLLQPIHIQTHERKLGLGESILILQDEISSLSKILDSIKCFYWISTTYGKFNGYLIHSVFSLNTPNLILDLIQAMEQNKLISDYYTFEIIDYKIKSIDLDYFHPKKGWQWDWNKWYSEIPKTSYHIKDSPLRFDENPSVVQFDFKDIVLIRHLSQNPKITLKRLKNALDLSESQISRRIRTLEDKGIIRGYKSIFTPQPNDDLLFFYCFLEFKKPLDQISSYFYQLPYNIDFLIENQNKICIRMSLSLRDYKRFLRGFDLLRPHLTSHFFQIIHHPPTARFQQVYDLFNKETNQWDTPVEKFIEIIKEYC